MTENKPPQNWLPKLDLVSLAISEIKVECCTWDVPESRYRGGYIKFTGAYGYGSAGTKDALFIRWRIHEFLELAPVWSLIVDLRELHYVWGNDLEIDTWELPKNRVCIVVPSKEENEEVYEAYKWLGENRLRTSLATAFRDLILEIGDEK